jgi:hypothetical protein
VQASVKFAALICFEDTAGDLTRRFVKDGAQALINLTNDGWFLRSCEPEQHLANAVFRAVETRRPLVRCCNTGVTGAGPADGKGGALDPASYARWRGQVGPVSQRSPHLLHEIRRVVHLELLWPDASGCRLAHSRTQQRA